MNLTIAGPNLRDCPTTFSVHKAGCRDLKRGELAYADKFNETHETVEFLVEATYGPDAGSFYEEHWGEDIPADAWTHYEGEFHLNPCCASLPRTA
jgi:hypothetical protein